MRKIYITILGSILVLTNATLAYAISPTPTPANISPTLTPKETDAQQNQIEKIKDLVASKVAELKLVDKRGIVGTVKSSSNTEMVVSDYRNDPAQIDIDELTKFQSDSDKTFGISDIKSGDVLSIVGLFNKDAKRLLARFITRATNIPQNIEGVVVSKDLKDFTFELVSAKGKKNTIDVSTSTKTVSYDNGQSVKSGFSKIDMAQRVIVVGFADPKIKDQINSTRIIVFSSIPPSSDMKKFETQANDVVPVSSGSAGKVQPITK